MNTAPSIPLAHALLENRFAPGRLTGLIVGVGVALILHVVAVARSPLIAPDGIGFIHFARELGTDPWTAIRGHAQHPGYPLLVMAVHTITDRLVAGDAGWEFAARLSCGLSGLACVALVWMFVRQVLDQSAANVAAVLFAILPTARQNAADALGDSTHLMLYLAAVYLVCRSTNGRSGWCLLLAGAVSGLAFWVRPEGLAVALVSAVGVLIVPAWHRALGGRRQALIGSLALLAGAALVAAPLVVTSGKLTGKLAGKLGWQASQYPAALSTGAASGRPVEQPPLPLMGTAPVVQVPGALTPWNDPLPRAAVAAVARLGTALAEVLHGFLLIPLLCGVFIASCRMARTSFSVCLMLALAQIGMLLLLYRLGGYIDRRHLLPLVALLMPSLSLGVLAIGRWLTELGQRRTGARWLAPAVAVCVLAVLVSRSTRPLHESRLHTLTAAAWLREHGRSCDSVGSNAVEVVYHAAIDGGILPGSRLRPWLPIDADGPLLRNKYLVVELDAENRPPTWSSGIPVEFTPTARIAGDPSLRQRDLVIYQRVDGAPSTAVSQSGARDRLR